MIRQQAITLCSVMILAATATIASGATVGTYTGGDPGEGLNLRGSFVYAVNVDGAGTSNAAPNYAVGGAVFQDDYANATRQPDFLSQLPQKPVHGDHRNVLFYDFHVGKMALDDKLLP